jgi:hypothetical protein
MALSRSVDRRGRAASFELLETLEDRRLMSAVVPTVSAPTGSISGYVYDDAATTPTMAGLAGRTVFADLNDSRLLEPGDPRAVTDSHGHYTLLGLAKGSYIIRQEVPLGWARSTPAGNSGRHVVLKAGETVKSVNLGEVPAAAMWADYGGNAQHTGLSTVDSQSLDAIKWSTPVDLQPQYSGNDLLIHYGSPLFTSNHIMILPVKTGATDGFEIQARNAGTGELLWIVTTDYVLPPSGWTPSYSPALTADNRLYFAGAGGTVYYIDHVDQAGSKTVHHAAFYGLSKYEAHKSAMNSTLFIDTPLTVDSKGDVYFGLQSTGSNPLNLTGGIARISASGQGAYVTAAHASGDATIAKVTQNCAPALSNDGKTLYLSVNRTSLWNAAAINAPDYLLALNSTTLKTVGKVKLIDPGDGSYAALPDIGTASPTIGPDGDVYYGILDSSNDNYDRGWLLHFNSSLTVQKTTAAFDWDGSQLSRLVFIPADDQVQLLRRQRRHR